MPASQYNFSIEQGTSFSLVLVNKDQNNTVIDLTGYCARIIAVTNTNETIIFDSENQNQTDHRFFITPLTGEITLLIPASTSNAYTFTSAIYDLEIQGPTEIYPGGGRQTERLLYGTISIIKRFTKSDSLLDCS